MTTTLFITLLSLHLVAVMSPGPDFFIVIKNTLQKGRVSGYATAAGIASGLMIHIGYSILGVGYIISKSILLMSGLKLLGGLYLIRIGYKSRTATGSAFNQNIKTDNTVSRSGFWQGFLTNVFNPKATLYFLSVFTTMVTPETSVSALLILGGAMIGIAGARFSLVSFFVGNNYIMHKYQSIEHHINKGFGSILMLLGAKVIISK